MLRVAKGCVEQLPSGSWRARVYAGIDPITKREIRLKATAKTEQQAHIELGRLLKEASEGHTPESDATLAKLLDEYAAIAPWDVSTGYIGSAVARVLAKHGHSLIALTRSTESETKLVALSNAIDFEFVRGDVLHPTSIRRGAEKADAVIHAASPGNDTYAAADNNVISHGDRHTGGIGTSVHLHERNRRARKHRRQDHR